ncbi:MAG: hypothetical protein ACYS9X_13305 [Planctomycetota bacterium]|jgi:hypothetical protein
MRTPSAVTLAGLCLALGGCPPLIVGPARGPVESIGTVASARRSRLEKVETLYAPGSGMRYSGPLGGRNRSVPLRADIILGTEDRFRIDIKHPLNGKDLFTVVLAKDEEEGVQRFLLVNHMKEKAFEGESLAVIRGRFPESSFNERDLSAWQLFFPGLAPREGERVEIVQMGARHVIEYWTPERIPVRAVEIDSHSHVPLREVFYRADGGKAAELVWSGLEYVDDLDIVRARDVEIRLPRIGRMIRFRLADARFNKQIREIVAFSLLPPDDMESEEVKPEPEKPSGGDEDAEGDS